MINKTLQKPLFSGHSTKTPEKIITNPTFIKWAGGKTQLLEQFKKFFPKEFNGYLEPFVGSGAVFFYIKQVYNPDYVILSDNNEELINAYEVVRDNVDELIDILTQHKTRHSKEYYYEIRDLNPKVLNKIEKAGRFIYLNKTCFNGLYRVNSKGKFNVPFGRYKNPSIVNDTKLKKASELLQNVELKVIPFEKIAEYAEEHDFLYFDPPYYPLSKTSNFTSYTSDSFTEEDQKRLAETYRILHEKGCKLMLSNSDTPFIKNLFNHGEFKIEVVRAKRVINSDARIRGEINEIVVLNY